MKNFRNNDVVVNMFHNTSPGYSDSENFNSINNEGRRRANQHLKAQKMMESRKIQEQQRNRQHFRDVSNGTVAPQENTFRQHFSDVSNCTVPSQEDASSSFDFPAATTPTRGNTISRDVKSDNKGMEENSRLSILQEMRMVMELKHKAKSVQDEAEVQLLSRHLELLNQELERINTASGISSENEIGPHQEEDSIVEIEIEKPPQSDGPKPLPKISENQPGEIKIRAPMDLEAGYEFTANIKGRVVNARVVSLIALNLCRT